MPKTWTDADAHVLRSLRESSRLSLEVLAKRHILSLAQVRELEGADSGRFYSDDIKAHVGHKLLKSLGHEPQAAAAPPVLASHADEAHASLQANAPSIPVPAVTGLPGSHQMGELDLVRPNLAQLARTRRPASSRRLLGVLGLLVLLGFGVRQVVRTSSVETRVPQPASAPSVADGASSMSAPVAPTSSVVSAGPACAVLNPKALTPYVSPSSAKPGTYVFVESEGEAQLCLWDGQGKWVSLKLRDGQSHTFSGTAPFAVQTADWGRVRVFYQGVQVKAEAAQAQTGLLLQPLATELTVPSGKP